MTVFNPEEIRAYEIIKQEDLPDIHAEGILLRHKKSGARVFLLPCEDDNKVFNIAFRTPPADSTGVAHIIEHTVLCGSKEFPLKDPFVELIKGSLNTFLNAMTYPDKTMYPVASTNDADFRNLMHVYLDAVFYPNIYREEKIFRQEGWHYEMEDPDQPLELNGVVYNEMKGVFSTPESVLERQIMNELYPDTAYGVESGGDPKHIPELTYEAYLDFHRRYYHPSNSYIFLYGNMDMADTLAFMDEHYLSNFDLLQIDSTLKKQEAFTEPVRKTSYYPVSDEEETKENAYISWNAVTGNQLDVLEMTACAVLDYALLSAPGAPVRQALLDSGICKDVSGEFVDGILQPYFSITARNADENRADEFVEIIRRVLREQAENGIDSKSLNAGLNFMEFQFREADFSSYPKGLMYSIEALDTWLYDENEPFLALKKLDVFKKLHGLAKEGYFENFIKEKLLDNPHSALIVLLPKAGMQEEEEQRLADELAEKKASMSKEEIRGIVDFTEQLRRWQEEPESPENIAKLPMLTREDIRKDPVRLSNEEETVPVKTDDGSVKDTRIIWHNARSNGIGYLEMLFDITGIREEDIPYVSLLKAVLLQVSTDEHSYMDLNNEVNAETGGIGTGILTLSDPKDEDGYQAYFGFSCKALYEKFESAFTLIREVMRESRFDDPKRIREIIAQLRAGLQVTLQQSGNAVAATRAMAYVSSENAFNDLAGGIAFYRFIKDLEDHYDEYENVIREKLETLSREIFNESRVIVSYTSEEEGRKYLLENLGKCLFSSGEKPVPGDRVIVKPIGRKNEGFMTAGQVQFVAMAGNFRNGGYEYTGTLAILRKILSFDYLWQNIRVKGGAYGCSAMFKASGDTIFTSYRDPNLRNTVDIYKAIPEYIENFRADEKEMTKYIIGTISTMDTPLTPSLLGTVSLRTYLRGVTDEEIAKRREQVLSASDEDIRALAPVVRAALEMDNLCVIGGSQTVSSAKELFSETMNLL